MVATSERTSGRPTPGRLARALPQRARPWRIGAAALALALGLSACGSAGSNGVSELSAAKALAEARAATLRAGSVRIHGSATTRGQTVDLDVEIGPHGGGGTITVKGATLDEVLSHGTIYIRASEAAWRKLIGTASVAALLGGKWISSAATGSLAPFAELLDLSELLGKLLPASGSSAKKSPTVRDGRRVLPVVDSKGATVYIDTTGPAYIEGVGAPPGASGGVTFDQYGTARLPSPPAHSTPLASLS